MPRGQVPAHVPREPDEPDVPERLETSVHTAFRAVEISERHLSALDLTANDATSLSFVDGRMTAVEMASVARGATFRDCIVEGGSWANVDATEARLVRVAFREVRMTGATFGGTTISDVTFSDCRLDFASLRFAKLDGVRFERCRLEDAELHGLAASSVVFSSCGLTRADITDASFERSEMRGCELEGIRGPESLRGIGMPVEDVLRSAVVLASGIGIRITNEE